MIRSKLLVVMAERRERSLAAVSRTTGISRATLSRFARDRTDGITWDTLARLCAYFGCGVGDLLEYVADEGGVS